MLHAQPASGLAISEMPPNHQATVGLVELFAFLRRARRTVALAICISLIAGGIYILVSHRTYIATAQVMVEPQIPQTLSRDSNAVVDQNLSNMHLESQVEYIRSDDVLLAVIQKLQLYADPEFNSASLSSKSTLEQSPLALPSVSSRLLVRRVGQSQIMNISFRAETAEKSATIANSIATTYVERLLQARIDDARRRRAWLEQRLQELAGQMQSTAQAVQGFRGVGQSQAKPGLETELAFSKLESESRTYQKIYDSVLQRLVETTQQESSLTSDARVIGHASQYLVSPYPKPSLVLVFSALCGLLGGFGLAAVRNAMDTKLRSVQDISKLGLRFLGTVPKIEADKVSKKSKQTDMRGAPALLSAALNRIKIQLDATRKSRPINALGFVSVRPHTGSSSVARHLARLYADGGIRTLLVEANVRELTMYAAPAQPGRSGERRQHVHAMHQVMEPAGSRLAITTLSTCYDQNNNLIPQAVDRLLSQEHSPFGLILFDFAALACSTAVLDFSDRLDGFVLVSDWQTTSATDLAEAAAALQIAGAALLGVVVNRAEAGFGTPI